MGFNIRGTARQTRVKQKRSVLVLGVARGTGLSALQCGTQHDTHRTMPIRVRCVPRWGASCVSRIPLFRPSMYPTKILFPCNRACTTRELDLTPKTLMKASGTAIGRRPTTVHARRSLINLSWSNSFRGPQGRQSIEAAELSIRRGAACIMTAQHEDVPLSWQV